jgi:N-acetyl-anhydromuramyl-L-alanine amidase AmpD
MPNYVVTRTGKVLQLLGDSSYTNYFSEENVNRNAIIVSLENLGWLEKKPLTNYYINWKGSIYNQQVYERKWRDFFFWQPYTTSQLETTAELCNQLIESQNIERKFIGHNTKVDGVSRYGGIVSRSNFDSNYTDLNPSFNFEMFTKIIENEQYAQ